MAAPHREVAGIPSRKLREKLGQCKALGTDGKALLGNEGFGNPDETVVGNTDSRHGAGRGMMTKGENRGTSLRPQRASTGLAEMGLFARAEGKKQKSRQKAAFCSSSHRRFPEISGGWYRD